ncbi:MAG: VWA domain-containing protein [Leptospira sp.]|nr:VWA domain-containing protein [Leptospira sp.]
MSFDFPWVLLLLGFNYWVYKNGFRSILISFAPVGFIQTKENQSNKKEKLVRYAELLLFSSLVLGIASPNLLIPRESIQMEGIDLAITLDLSASMQAADFQPNRLEAMKSLVSEYLEEMRGNRTTIVVFSGEVFLHFPFTNNKYALMSAIDSIHFQTINHNSAGGTNIGDAILFSKNELMKVKVEKREQAIVLITDGENTGGLDPNLAAKDALVNGIHLYIVGLAGEKPVPVFEEDGSPYIGADGKQLITTLNDTSLKQIAETGGGVYYRAKEGESLKGILKEIGELEKLPLEMKNVNERVSLSLPISFLILISFIIFVFGTGMWIRRPIR